MTRKIYPLLVALDLYDPSSRVPSLSGCVTDIESIELYLREQVAGDDWELVEPRVLKNEQATRDGVIAGFQEFLGQATENDVALFYYAGHGAQERAPEEFLPLEPDGMNETLVCYDSRTTTGRDLADKELRYLIAQVAQKNPHILVLMDCCHSGGGTRDVAEGTRQGPADDRVRPLSSYLFAQDLAFLQDLNSEGNLPEGRHVVLSACRDYQLAKECRGEDGKAHGAFSYYLLETLQRSQGKMSYRELIRNLNALVSSKQRDQSPLIYATNGEDLSLSFLGGAASSEVSDGFTLTYSDRDRTWFIDGGAVHGVPKPSGDQTTMLAVMPVDVPAEESRSLSHAVARLKVIRVMGNRSQVEITEGEDKLYKRASYRAIVTSTPLRPLMVFFKADEGEEAGIELARSTFATSGPAGQPSLQLKEAEQAFGADVTLLCRDGQFWFVNPVDDLPVVGPVPHTAQDSYSQKAAEQAIARLEHMARWQTVLDLAAPARSQIRPGDITFEVLKVSVDGALQPPLDVGSGEVSLPYELDRGILVSPDIVIRLTNNSRASVYCDVLSLDSDYSINRSFFLRERESNRAIRIGPGESFEDDVSLEIDEEKMAAGITVVRDVFKVIISTTDFDASLMVQDGLDLPPPPTRNISVEAGTLDLMMGGVGTRKVVPSKRRADDWVTMQVAVEVVRPQESMAIGDGRTVELLEDQVTVEPHGSLRAEASLTSAAVVSRDVDAGPTMPAMLQMDQSVVGAFQFSSTRGSDPGLSVLEISSCPNPDAVTSEDPLKLRVNSSIADNEKVLALGKEGDLFVPVGYGKCTGDGCTEISIEKLPEPQISSRSLTGSMKIFFHKLVSDRLVGSFDAYPQLASVTLGDGPDAKPNYNIDVPHVKARVAAASNIVMYIHGIIGDTASMVGSIWDVGLVGDGGYDLVLAFDYENLNTPIEGNAKKLRERLEAVGLGAGHSKNFHIIAHSMGGLVSRWFIEQEGGKDMVQHLSMFGTPNGGSPWSAVQDWAFTSLTFGLNSLSTMFWPAGTVAQLLDAFDDSVVSLDQMNVKSDFIAAIAETPDPGIPYTIIAGDRSLSPQAKDADGKLSPKLMGTLTKFLGKTIDTVVDTVFIKQPNDIAVTLESIKRVDSSRSPQPKILPDSACDHLTYFASEPGLECLKAAQTAALAGDGVEVSDVVNLDAADQSPSTGETSRGLGETPAAPAPVALGAPDPAPPEPSDSGPSADTDDSSPAAMIFFGTVVAVTVGIVIAVVIGLSRRSPEPVPENTPENNPSEESSLLLPPAG
ncbi:MAG: caspase family protein [Cyanobacteria bacterium P01_C01_bin.89]